MCQKAQSGFRGIFIGMPQHQKGYLVYVPSTNNIISPYDALFYESFSSALAYTSRPYSEVIDMRQSMIYTPYATSSKEKTGNMITFAQFEEGYLSSETRDDAESGDKSDED